MYICGRKINDMERLNLPQFELKRRRNVDLGFEEIWDEQRKRWVKLTPEEWVRQNFVRFLISVVGYPAGRIGNEVPIRVGQLEKRCDTVVFGDDAQALMIVEYKATTVTITQQTFDQISRYNLSLKVDWLLVSNGLQHYVCHFNRAEQRWEFLREIPAYQALTQQ